MIAYVFVIHENLYQHLIVFHHVIDKLFFLLNGQMNMAKLQKWIIYIEHIIQDKEQILFQTIIIFKMDFILIDHFNFKKKYNKSEQFLYYLFLCRSSYFFIRNISFTSSAKSDQLISSLTIDKRSVVDDGIFSPSDSLLSLSITTKRPKNINIIRI